MKGQKGEQNKLLTEGDSLMAYETEDQETQYCFPDINSSCVKGERSSYEYYSMYVFFSLLSAWTVFLNLLVIISISHFKKLHTPTNMLILSLAVNDLLVGLIVMPIEAIKLIGTCWYFGDTLCDLFLIIMGLLLSTSLCNLVLIAVDRYVAVCHPLLYTQKITMTRTLFIVCICWVFTSSYNIAIVRSTSHRTSGCYGECNVKLSLEWRVTDLIFSFLLPCTVIITLHLRIFYAVHQQVKVINSQMKRGKVAIGGSVKKKTESKAALSLGIIVAIHLLCWIPYFILTLTDNMAIPPTVLYCLIWVLYINSCLDPLFYAFFYTWFRKSIKHILTLKIFQLASSHINIFTNNS
ncbi:trace amine-associated receptor 13c-like [Danio rerio]|uniref:Trace amine-associated receptor 13c-like n=1 Tax=Danio rerio TaxID=7955 RepID=A0AB32U0Z6_DANRE